jgi:hypothetical protein
MYHIRIIVDRHRPTVFLGAMYLRVCRTRKPNLFVLKWDFPSDLQLFDAFWSLLSYNTSQKNQWVRTAQREVEISSLLPVKQNHSLRESVAGLCNDGSIGRLKGRVIDEIDDGFDVASVFTQPIFIFPTECCRCYHSYFIVFSLEIPHLQS